MLHKRLAAPAHWPAGASPDSRQGSGSLGPAVAGEGQPKQPDESEPSGKEGRSVAMGIASDPQRGRHHRAARRRGAGICMRALLLSAAFLTLELLAIAPMMSRLLLDARLCCAAAPLLPGPASSGLPLPPAPGVCVGLLPDPPASFACPVNSASAGAAATGGPYVAEYPCEGSAFARTAFLALRAVTFDPSFWLHANDYGYAAWLVSTEALLALCLAAVLCERLLPRAAAVRGAVAALLPLVSAAARLVPIAGALLTGVLAPVALLPSSFAGFYAHAGRTRLDCIRGNMGLMYRKLGAPYRIASQLPDLATCFAEWAMLVALACVGDIRTNGKVRILPVNIICPFAWMVAIPYLLRCLSAAGRPQLLSRVQRVPHCLAAAAGIIWAMLVWPARATSLAPSGSSSADVSICGKPTTEPSAESSICGTGTDTPLTPDTSCAAASRHALEGAGASCGVSTENAGTCSCSGGSARSSAAEISAQAGTSAAAPAAKPCGAPDQGLYPGVECVGESDEDAAAVIGVSMTHAAAAAAPQGFAGPSPAVFDLSAALAVAPGPKVRGAALYRPSACFARQHVLSLKLPLAPPAAQGPSSDNGSTQASLQYSRLASAVRQQAAAALAAAAAQSDVGAFTLSRARMVTVAGCVQLLIVLHEHRPADGPSLPNVRAERMGELQPGRGWGPSQAQGLEQGREGQAQGLEVQTHQHQQHRILPSASPCCAVRHIELPPADIDGGVSGRGAEGVPLEAGAAGTDWGVQQAVSQLLEDLLHGGQLGQGDVSADNASGVQPWPPYPSIPCLAPHKHHTDSAAHVCVNSAREDIMLSAEVTQELQVFFDVRSLPTSAVATSRVRAIVTHGSTVLLDELLPLTYGSSGGTESDRKQALSTASSAAAGIARDGPGEAHVTLPRDAVWRALGPPAGHQQQGQPMPLLIYVHLLPDAIPMPGGDDASCAAGPAGGHCPFATLPLLLLTVGSTGDAHVDDSASAFVLIASAASEIHSLMRDTAAELGQVAAGDSATGQHSSCGSASDHPGAIPEHAALSSAFHNSIGPLLTDLGELLSLASGAGGEGGASPADLSAMVCIAQQLLPFLLDADCSACVQLVLWSLDRGGVRLQGLWGERMSARNAQHLLLGSGTAFGSLQEHAREETAPGQMAADDDFHVHASSEHEEGSGLEDTERKFNAPSSPFLTGLQRQSAAHTSAAADYPPSAGQSDLAASLATSGPRDVAAEWLSPAGSGPVHGGGSPHMRPAEHKPVRFAGPPAARHSAATAAPAAGITRPGKGTSADQLAGTGLELDAPAAFAPGPSTRSLSSADASQHSSSSTGTGSAEPSRASSDHQPLPKGLSTCSSGTVAGDGSAAHVQGPAPARRP